MNVQDLKDCILSWGSLDEKYLDILLGYCDKIGVTFEELDTIVGDFDDVTNINNWIYSCIYNLFVEYSKQLLDFFEDTEDYYAVKSYLQKLNNKFDPFINCSDSWFNNIFDDFEFDLDTDTDLLRKEIGL